MILTLDNLAAKYHCLPSEALARGTSFDLMVLDVATRWQNFQYEQQNGAPHKKPLPRLSENEMLDMIKRAREQ